MPAPTTILGNQAPSDRVIQIGQPDLDMPATGWDTLREFLWVPHPFWFKRGDVREGPAPEGGTFIVQDVRVVEWRAGRPIVEVMSLGIALNDGKDFKLECSAGLSEDLSLADGSPHTIWRINYPRVTKIWVSLTTPAIYAHVGIASLPPDTFGIGGGVWSMAWISSTSWTASGWLGESRVPQQLPGSKACLVTDTWLYDVGYDDRDTVAGGIIYL